MDDAMLQTWGVFWTLAILSESSGRWGASHARWAAVLCRLLEAHERATSSPPAGLSNRSKIWGCTKWTVLNYLRKKCSTISDLTPNLSGDQRENFDPTEAATTALVECVSQPGIAPLEHYTGGSIILLPSALLQRQSKIPSLVHAISTCIAEKCNPLWDKLDPGKRVFRFVFQSWK